MTYRCVADMMIRFLPLLLLIPGAAEAEDLERPSGTTSPEVITTYPSHFFQSPSTGMSDTVDLGTFTIEFGVPVTGVRAQDLLINGSAAIQVSGSGAGPYTFTGYAAPHLGPVQVVLSPGDILRDSDAHPRFEGDAWAFRLFDPLNDDDGDTLTNQQEVEHHSDPLSVDTDHDGLPDPYELAHACLSVVTDEATPQEAYAHVVPGDDDADDDGVTNHDEFVRGTDPCAP